MRRGAPVRRARVHASWRPSGTACGARRPRGSRSTTVIGKLEPTTGERRRPSRRRRAARVGQGRPRGQHAPGRGPRADGAHIRRTATARGIPCVTTVAAALAASAGLLEKAAPRGDGPLPAGVPPRRPAPPRRVTPRAPSRFGVGQPRHDGGHATPERGGREVTLGRVRAAEPDRDRVGHVRARREVAQLGDASRLGAITAKSLAADAWPGKPAPRLHMTAAGMLNAVGLQGPGVDRWIAHDLPALRARGARVHRVGVGHDGRRLRTRREVAAARARRPRRDRGQRELPEPHHAREQIFAHDPDATAAAIARGASTPASTSRCSPSCRPNVTDLTTIAARRRRCRSNMHSHW